MAGFDPQCGGTSVRALGCESHVVRTVVLRRRQCRTESASGCGDLLLPEERDQEARTEEGRGCGRRWCVCDCAGECPGNECCGESTGRKERDRVGDSCSSRKFGREAFRRQGTRKQAS